MANLNDFARDLSTTTRFVIENIAVPDKLVRVFQYPIPIRGTRDLLKIRGVGEADIRASLLKGELRVKILAKEIRVVESDIDLLQFNLDEKSFLQSAGITDGLEITALGSGITEVQHKTLRDLIHLADGVGGPMDGFMSGAYRETLPQDNPFPTSIIWWESSSKVQKIVEKNLSYDSGKRITSISWKVYDTNGTLLATATDTFSYNGNSPFESSRTRVIS